MLRLSMTSCVILFSAAAAIAQPLPLPAGAPSDLAAIPPAIKTLPWQSIDLSKVPLLEESRALMLMNHVLTELTPIRASEADLMSTYLEAKGLGKEFAKASPPQSTAKLTFTDANKIAVALLRGPMSGSDYATALSDMSPASLAAYQQMYDSTCQRRWGELSESVQEVRNMGGFIQARGKMPDYQAWAKTESADRQQKFEQEQAKLRTTKQEAQEEAAAERARLAKQRAEDQQMQLAMVSAQTQQADSNSQQNTGDLITRQGGVYTSPESNSPEMAPSYDPYATGYGYAVPPYYGGNTGWFGSPGYSAAARSNTEARFDNWRSVQRQR